MQILTRPFANWSLRTKILGALGVVAILAGAAGVFGVLQLRSTTGTFVEKVGSAQMAALEGAQLRTAFQLQHQDWKDILIRGTDPAVFTAKSAAVQTDAKAVAAKHDELAATLATVGSVEGKQFLADFDAGYAHYMELYATALVAVHGPNGWDMAAGDGIMKGQDRPAQAALASLSDTLASQAQAATDAAVVGANRTQLITGIVLALAVIVGIAIGLVLAKHVVGRLSKLTAASDRISKGDIKGLTIELSGRDEINRLGDSMSGVVAAFEELYAETAALTAGPAHATGAAI
jgi:methyl-accepting chemotaxis protein